MNIEKDFIIESIKQCLEDGQDKYIVITMNNKKQCKCYNEVSKNDVIYYKIILTWKEKSLSYKLIEYPHPYKIEKRIKLKLDNERGVYLILHLIDENKFTFNNPNNKLKFDSLNEILEAWNNVFFYEKSERDYILLK